MTDTTKPGGVDLLPCPFCGGDAEMDSRQGYRNFATGASENRIAAYCRDCGADIGVCIPDELRSTIERARAVSRRVDICPYVFGTQEGSIYTKSGWGANWRRIMAKCGQAIDEFQPFTLRDCRPGGITAKRGRHDDDTQDATLHRDSRMIETTYDRRRGRRAKPAH